jgi:hypothetical protein
MHLYRRALKGSLDRTGNVLMWRPEALAIRAQFESHRVQNTLQDRAKHLKYLEMIAENNATTNPFICEGPSLVMGKPGLTLVQTRRRQMVRHGTSPCSRPVPALTLA